jgi:hypothetical protein
MKLPQRMRLYLRLTKQRTTLAVDSVVVVVAFEADTLVAFDDVDGTTVVVLVVFVDLWIV